MVLFTSPEVYTNHPSSLLVGWLLQTGFLLVVLLVYLFSNQGYCDCEVGCHKGCMLVKKQLLVWWKLLSPHFHVHILQHATWQLTSKKHNIPGWSGTPILCCWYNHGFETLSNWMCIHLAIRMLSTDWSCVVTSLGPLIILQGILSHPKHEVKCTLAYLFSPHEHLFLAGDLLGI